MIFPEIFIFMFMFFPLLICHVDQKPFVLYMEKTEVKFSDPKAVRNVTSTVIFDKTNTSSKLYIRMYVIKAWMNNVTVRFLTYTYRNNKYQKSFIQKKDGFCDLINTDHFLMPMFQKFGNMPKKCPLIGQLAIDNLTLLTEYFPSNFPISRWKFDFTIYHTVSNKMILKYAIYLVSKSRTKEMKRLTKH